jgi:excisionase family DNA binding protein
MARIFDVIEYPNEMANEIVHRFPETGIGDFRIGSQLIVRESQWAVFFRDGNALDVFKAGRHTISTANVPLLIDLIGKAFNDRTPFPAEVYFVARKEFASMKWGTSNPILVRNPGMGLGAVLMQGYGTYSFQVKDPQQFVTQVVGTSGAYTTNQIEDRLRDMLLSKVQDVLTEAAIKNAADVMGAMNEEIGAAVRAKAQDDFEALGLTLKTFYIGNMRPSSKTAQELRDMGVLDPATYAQLQAADAMREAASNPSGGAGLTAGIGAGMGIGNLMQQATSGMAQQQQGSAGGAAKTVWPDVMTPGEAASYMKVTEEDVMAAIKDKSLKAKKVGNAYRISKAVIDEYLAS